MVENPHDPERDYFYRRAEQELEQAQRSDNPAAMRAHYMLAGYYLDRLYGASPVALQRERM